jgi:hypothetical protein
VTKRSLYTPEGAVEHDLPVLPGVPFPNPLPNYVLGVNLFWQVDIWRQLRNATDAAVQRFLGTAAGRQARHGLPKDERHRADGGSL